MTYVNHYASPMGELLLASDGEAITGLWFRGGQILRPGPGPCRPGAGPARVPIGQSLAGRLLRRPGARRSAAPAPGGDGLPAAGVGPAAPDPLRRHHHLRGAGPPAGGGPGPGLRPGGGGARWGATPSPCSSPAIGWWGAGGSLTGYAGGVDKKLALLRLEGADCSRLSLPKTGTAL